MQGPLHGVKILDLSRLLPGPACTWFLAGLGARVDRVETPGRGDFTRFVPPFVDGVGALFCAISRGKRSVAIELKHSEGPALVRAMLPHYDVIVEGFRPGVMEAMGLDPKELVRGHPGLVVARLSGFGQAGPLRERVGHDVNYVGFTGLLAGMPLGWDGPLLPSAQVADFSGAMVAAMGIAAALFERERQRKKGTPAGRVLDVSLTEAALALMAPTVLAASVSGKDPQPGGELLTGGAPIYGCYRCKDGRWITVGALEPKFQAELARHTGVVPSRHDLVEVFAARTRAEWVELLKQACVGPVLAPTEVGENAHFKARGAVARLGRATVVRPPLAERADLGVVPALGEHTEAVLLEAGVSADEVTRLRESGAVA